MKIFNLYISKFVFVFVCLLLIGFYLLTVNTPRAIDDFFYSDYLLPNGEFSLRRLNTIMDIIESRYNAWFYDNGRTLSQFFLQLYTGLLDKYWYNIANTFMFACFIISYLLLVGGKNVFVDVIKVIVAIFVLWFLIPVFGETLLWLSGSTSTMWAATWCLIFLLVYEREVKLKRSKGIYNVIYFLGALCAGWSHEGIALPVSGALFLYYCLHIKKLRGTVLFLVLGFWIGTILVAFAPGIWKRADSQIIFSCTNFFWGIKRVLIYTKAFPLLVLGFIIGLFISKSKMKEFVIENKFLLGVILLSVCFNFVIGLNGQRQLFFIELFSMILLVKMLFYLHSFYKRKKLVISICLSLISFDYCYAYIVTKQNYEITKQLESDYLTNKDGVVKLSHVYKPTLFNENGRSRFVISRFYNHNSQNPLNEIFVNDCRANKPFIVLPEYVYNNLYLQENYCVSSNLCEKLMDLYTTPDTDFYVMKLPESDTSKYVGKSVNYIYEQLPDSQLAWYVRLIKPFAKRLNTPTYLTLENAVTQIHTSYGDYLLIDKPHYLTGEVVKLTINKY